MISGLHGATAVLATVLGIESGVESAVHIDISAQDTLMQHWCRHLAQYAYGGTLTRRGARDPRGIHARHTAMAADGWLYLLALNIPWQDVAAFLGLGEYITLGEDGAQPWDEMKDAFHEAVASRPRYDWFADAAEMGWTFAPVEDPFQLMENPQTTAREAFEERTIEGRRVKLPKLPFRIDEEDRSE
jgi:crotonobetainyl-CoA:carnitine CoA-transferase CaiB-like acyl-CoA transferase